MSVQAIVETVLKAPKDFLNQAVKSLAEATKAMSELGLKRFLEQRELLQSLDSNATAQPGKNFKKVPFLRGLNVDRDEKLTELDEKDKPTPRFS